MSNSLRQKLCNIQTQLKAPKGQTHAVCGYRYRSAEYIFEALKPLLREYWCSLIIQDEIVDISNRVYVKATANIVDNDTDADTDTDADANSNYDEHRIQIIAMTLPGDPTWVSSFLALTLMAGLSWTVAGQ